MSVNKVMLLGHLGKGPEKRQVGDTVVTVFSLATGEKWTDKRSGEIHEKTQWHNVEAWGRTGEIAAEYLSKGSEVFIEGTLDYQTWDKKDGGKGYKTIVKALSLQFVGSGGQRGEDSDDQGADSGQEPERPGRAAPTAAAKQSAPRAGKLPF